MSIFEKNYDYLLLSTEKSLKNDQKHQTKKKKKRQTKKTRQQNNTVVPASHYKVQLDKWERRLQIWASHML